MHGKFLHRNDKSVHKSFRKKYLQMAMLEAAAVSMHDACLRASMHRNVQAGFCTWAARSNTQPAFDEQFQIFALAGIQSAVAAPDDPAVFIKQDQSGDGADIELIADGTILAAQQLAIVDLQALADALDPAGLFVEAAA